MRAIGRGRTAEILEYSSDLAVKLFRDGYPAKSVEKEFHISKYAHSLGMDTPRPVELTQMRGRLGIVCQRVSGKTMLATLASRPWRLTKLAKTMAEIHCRMHKLAADASLPEQKAVLAQNIRQSCEVTPAEAETIIGHLDRLESGNSLCHGDFHPDNILLADRPWVIDWQNGTAGNPAGDVARSLLLLTFGSMPPGTPLLITGVVNLLRRAFKNCYLRQYMRQSAINRSEVEQWLLPVAAARLGEHTPGMEKDNLAILIKTLYNKISL